MNLFKKAALGLTLAFGALLSGPASADVICDTCSYLTAPAGTVATYLGDHDPGTNDNSTFGNSTTGQVGAFSNWWIFSINPAGLATVDAVFLPISNVANFDVKLYSLTSQTCGAQVAGSGTGGACSAYVTGALVADGFTPADPADFVTAIDFTALTAGYYAFNITGTVLQANTSSYTGNLQVQAAVPEPGSLALIALGLLVGGVSLRNRRA